MNDSTTHPDPTYGGTEVSVTNDARILVRCGYNTKFILSAKRLAGRWLPEEKLWAFSAQHERLVRDLCVRWFGTDGTTPPDLVDVRIAFPKAKSQHEGPVTIFGRIVASARSRNSTARLGEGVVFVEGQAFSNGDHKGWRTVVGEGSVVHMSGVPRALAVAEAPTGVVVTIIEREGPVDKSIRLQAERDRLVARIAEIDAAMSEGQAGLGNVQT